MTGSNETKKSLVPGNFTDTEWAVVDDIIKRHQAKEGALITVLEEIQEAVGYLPKSIQKRVSEGLSVPLSEVHGVVTFYSFFRMMPKGDHTIRCCMGTACYVRGGSKLLEKVSQRLHINPGETTEDVRFSLETVRCLGACGLAPVIMVDEETHRQVKPAKVNDIIKEYQ